MLPTRLPQSTLDAEEWRLRRELTDFYHLVDFLGWTEMIFNHISVRLPAAAQLPGATEPRAAAHHYLVNPFGLNYAEITPENLLKVGVDGQLVEPSDYPANPAGFALHGAIHESRADVACVAHTHTTQVSAIAMKRGGFDHNNFYGAQIYGRVAYHEFEGITLYPDERSRMLASLGDKHVLVLRNHGIAVCERDIPTTFMLLWVVQRAAEIQCQAGALGGEDVLLTPAVQERCRAAAGDLASGMRVARMVWDAAVRRMRANDGPGSRNGQAAR
jgi:ribulose-5-phosphate 4-epimerase/fuculose-1-phosphate aldolase